MDEFRTLMMIGGALVLLQLYCDWRRPRWHDHFGLPVYSAHIRLLGPATSAPTATHLQILQPPFFWGWLNFHDAGLHEGKPRIGFRERFRWPFIRFMPMMHAVIDIDASRREARLTGYANYTPLALLLLFVVQGLAGQLEPALVTTVLFVFIFCVVAQIAWFRTLTRRMETLSSW